MAIDGTFLHLALAAASFVITHFSMSGPLRKKLVSLFGDQGFLLFYSVVSLVTFAWMVVAFDRTTPSAALWDGTHPVTWFAGSILTIVALALIVPSFGGNPALPGRKAAGLGTVIPTGVFTITRHPMMWGITLWAIAHILVAPEPRVLLFMGGLILVALLGSHFQDKRKLAQNKREFSAWQRRTRFWPDVRQFPRLGIGWGIALLLWLIATTLHWELFGIPAGFWVWLA